MAVDFLFVDVLIRQIHAAGKTGVAVDDANLPVVPVVEAQGQDGHKGIEDLALDPVFPKKFIVFGGKGHNAAQVVEHDPHVQPFRRLLDQNGQDAVPHDPLLDDEIFKEDVMLRFFQLLQHPGELRLAGGEVFGIGVTERRGIGIVFDVAGLIGGVHVLFGQLLHSVGNVFFRLPEPFGHSRHFFPLPTGQLVSAENQVHQSAENGKGQNRDQPCDLVGGIVPVIDDIKHHQNA